MEDGYDEMVLTERFDMHPESKWNNIEIAPKLVCDIAYYGDNRIEMVVVTEEGEVRYDLVDFAATKLFRMTGVHKKGVHERWERETEGKFGAKISVLPMIDSINTRSPTDVLILRETKEDGMIRSIVGKQYLPIDMEELEAHAFQSMLDNEFHKVGVQRFKSNYARGHDITRIKVNDIHRTAPKIGDVMSIGIQIMNNELGTRGISACLFTTRLACSNGMCHYNTEMSISDTHLGDRNTIFMRFDEICDKIIDDAWNILEWVDRADSVGITYDQMNNYLNNLVMNGTISGKVADEIKQAFNKASYGPNDETLWSLVNAMSGVSSHQVSHGVQDSIERAVSMLMEQRSLTKIEDQLKPLDAKVKLNTKSIISPMKE